MHARKKHTHTAQTHTPHTQTTKRNQIRPEEELSVTPRTGDEPPDRNPIGAGRETERNPTETGEDPDRRNRTGTRQDLPGTPGTHPAA